MKIRHSFILKALYLQITWLLVTKVIAQGNSVHLFIANTGGITEYRIPAMIATTSGTVLAICDARVDKPGDVPNNVDQVIRRSTDDGQSWDKLRTIVDFPNQEGAADPQLIQDPETGRIFLFYVFCPGRSEVDEGPAFLRRHLQTHYIYSDDDGVTWSLPIVVEHGLKKEGWHSFWPSPGRGVQLSDGRLVVMVTMHNFEEVFALYLFSDDHGENWNISDPIAPGLSEAKLVELDDGTLMMNSRNATGQGKRAIATSKDRGQTWSELKYHPELIEPGCNGSIVKTTYKGKTVLVFSNPSDASKRINMTVKASFDEGATWPVSKTIHPGPSAYSCMTVLTDGDLGLLYENGEESPYERITFLKLSLEELMEE